MKASDAGFDGTDEKFALAIADCMEQFEINKRPLKPAIFQKFGEENGEKVYNQLKEKYVYLVNSLTCKNRKSDFTEEFMFEQNTLIFEKTGKDTQVPECTGIKSIDQFQLKEKSTILLRIVQIKCK